MTAAAARGVLLAIVGAGGCAALIYQVIWQRLLTFVTGAGAHSVTIIVATFMVGLGVGSLAGGYLADRLSARARLWAFTACEVAIAAFALVSVSLFYDVTDMRPGVPDLSPFAAVAVKMTATLWPTFFMGLSFPLAARLLAGYGTQPAGAVAILYGVNAAGAAAGAVVAVTLLLPSLDFVRIVQLGALINLACAVAAAGLAVLAPPVGEVPAAARVVHTPAASAPPSMAWWTLVFALSGFTALALEVVWFRLLGVILKGNALTFGYLLLFFLGGLGLGAMASSLTAPRWPAARTFLLLQAAIPVYAAVSLGVFVGALEHVPLVGRLSFYLSGGTSLRPDDLFSATALVVRWMIPVWLMAVPTVLMGLSFGSLQRAVQHDLAHLGRRVGWLQAANIAGATLGALATGFVLLDRVGTPGTLRLLVMVAGVFLWLAVRDRGSRAGRAVATAAVVAVSLAAVPGSQRLWPRLHGATTGVMAVAEDSSGVALLRESGSGRTLLFANGRGQSELPYGGIHTVLGALPALLHPLPARVAVIGLGSGNTAFSIGARPETERIDSIEIISPVLTALRDMSGRGWYPGLSHLLADPRVRHHVTDGRVFIAKARDRYDVIEADARRPGAAYAGNLYSVEFFSLLGTRLNPGGLLVTWVPTDRVLHTLRAAMPHVAHWGEVGIASDRPIPIDVAALQRRLADPFTVDRFTRAGIDLAGVLQPYLRSGPTVYDPGSDPPLRDDLNRDLFPRDEFGPR